MRRLISFVLAIFLVLVFVIGASFYIAATRWRSQAAVEVEIPQGAPVTKIAETLYQNGVIRTPRLFEICARLKGASGKLKAGTYEFPAGTTLVLALGKIERGDVRQYSFTVVEGWTIKEIAASLANKPFLASKSVPDEFVKLAGDKDLISSLGIGEVPMLEGYLFPDTYFFTKPLTAEAFVKRLAGRFREIWNSLDQGAIEAAGLNEKEIVTLASIIEKETGAPDERPLIASVFLNRLKIGMPLQSDPTIIYGLPNYDGNIHKSDISNPHPYNTYVHGGLPPGPICNPGKASIEAVIHPADSKYLYFVSKNDGTHQFSETISEHLIAVRKYQLYQK